MFLYCLHDLSNHLRTSIAYLTLFGILVSLILLLVTSVTFQRATNTQKFSHAVDWVWAVIPLVMIIVMLIPIVNAVFSK